MADISERIVVPVDIKCSEPGCKCFREGVSGGITKQGEYLAPEGERDCPKCKHPSAKHKVIGETKSDYEKKHGKKPI